MTDPRRTLSPTEIREAGLADWRRILSGLSARFTTTDFATGLALVNQIAAAAEEADHHPDLVLKYGEVRVLLVSHDVGGVTSRDLELAHRISALAAAVGAQSTPLRQSEVELCLDAPDGSSGSASFYAALFDGKTAGGDVVDPSGQVPNLWFQGTNDGGPELPVQEPPQRWHLDVWVPEDEAEARVRAALEAGGTLVSDAAAPSYWVLADADGNRSCVCSTADR